MDTEVSVVRNDRKLSSAGEPNLSTPEGSDELYNKYVISSQVQGSQVLPRSISAYSAYFGQAAHQFGTLVMPRVDALTGIIQPPGTVSLSHPERCPSVSGV